MENYKLTDPMLIPRNIVMNDLLGEKRFSLYKEFIEAINEKNCFLGVVTIKRKKHGLAV